MENKTYDEFINDLWAYESSVDPDKQEYYNTNWNNPVIDSYPQVEYPGRVVRDGYR